MKNKTERRNGIIKIIQQRNAFVHWFVRTEFGEVKPAQTQNPPKWWNEFHAFVVVALICVDRGMRQNPKIVWYWKLFSRNGPTASGI